MVWPTDCQFLSSLDREVCLNYHEPKWWLLRCCNWPLKQRVSQRLKRKNFFSLIYIWRQRFWKKLLSKHKTKSKTYVNTILCWSPEGVGLARIIKKNLLRNGLHPFYSHSKILRVIEFCRHQRQNILHGPVILHVKHNRWRATRPTKTVRKI